MVREWSKNLRKMSGNFNAGCPKTRMPCVNENNSGNFTVVEKIRYCTFGNPRHILIFCTFSGLNMVHVIRTGGSARNSLFSALQRYFCILSLFSDNILCLTYDKVVFQVEIKIANKRFLKQCLLNYCVSSFQITNVTLKKSCMVKFEVYFERNAALFCLAPLVITPVWPEKTDRIHSVTIALGVLV